jgi:septal ring factor EnvC (AmiA/AmiB activator)
MKAFKIKLFTFNFALAALLAVLAGCVSKSYDKGAATSAALQSSANAVAETSTKVNDVLAALNNLTFKSQGDLRNQFDAFVSAIGKLDKSNDKLGSKVAEMQARASVYFDNWSNQLAAIQNEELRKRSIARKDEVTARLADVNTSYEGVKNSFRPFMSDVKDIQTYLGTDLTAGGLATVKDIVTKTKVDAVPLRDSIKKLQASFGDMSTALSPMMPVPDKK